jgi:2,3-dihydroxybiphenyl 1,2-dioxygenase
MGLIALGYIGVETAKIDDWREFAGGLLGMQLVDKTRDRLAFRMDDRRQRLIIHGGRPDGLAFMGFEVAERSDLEAFGARLEADGVAVTYGSRGLADERHVGELIAFRDPGGNPIELFCAPEVASDAFRPGRPITGFRTGALGMGHVVLHVEDVDRLLPFYRDTLGFRVTDFGHDPYKLYFFHLNGRHHNFAMVGSGRRSIHHFMVEVASLDDLGQGYDLAQVAPSGVAYTLGRHTNDHIMSFYANSPSGFFVEYGWGGRTIDPPTWQPHETTDGPSLWGHDRLYDMPADQRTRLHELRLSAGVRGLQAPSPPVNCSWLDAVIARE